MIFLKPKIRNLEGWVFCNYGNIKLKFKETAQNMRKRIEKTDQKFQMQVPYVPIFICEKRLALLNNVQLYTVHWDM